MGVEGEVREEGRSRGGLEGERASHVGDGAGERPAAKRELQFEGKDRAVRAPLQEVLDKAKPAQQQVVPPQQDPQLKISHY